MFVDKRKIQVKAGDGGNGLVHFSGAYGPKRKPYGGNGGKGGNVILEGTTGRYDLYFLKTDFLYEAENGRSGGVNNMTGREGNDLIIKVPIATNVYNDAGERIARIDSIGQQVVLLEGGQGGLGNYHFRAGGVDTLYKITEGDKVETFDFLLELELLSDAIFIGYPNAGKSSILKELTNADAKVAHYAFTTIDPQQGRLKGVTLMDLPGLIEGTFEGRGLGTEFVKHTRSAKLLVHFISLESEDLDLQYKSMRDELEKIGEELDQKKEIIILTKSDILEPEVRDSKMKEMEQVLRKYDKSDIPVLVVSIYDLDAMKELEDVLVDLLK